MRMRSCTAPVGPCFLLLSMLVLAAPHAVTAQGSFGEREDPPRFHAGLAGAVAQPRGEFADYVSLGGGIHGFFRVGLDRRGILGLRVQGGFLNYGSETQRVCLSATVGCRIEVDLTTSNNIIMASVGPEIGVPVGPVRLYASATGGVGYFSTDSQVGGSVGDEPFATTRNFGDGGLSWNLGGGLEIPLARARNVPIALDLGVSHEGNGRREYLTRGGITDLPDGSLQFDVKRSEANFFLWRIGVSVGIRPEIEER